MWIHGLGAADSWDNYFYNNADASGSQLYPKGISKYFDVYSVDGIIAYSIAWLWMEVQQIAMPYTLLIPIDVWLALFSGKSLDGLWKLFLFYDFGNVLSNFIPQILAGFFDVEMEDGWGILNY